MISRATHLPILIDVVMKSQGPIVEFGCGYYSTFPLHYLCMNLKRKLVTIDINEEWISKFEFLKSNLHEIIHISSWDEFKFFDDDKWGVVFIDHSPVDRRNIDIQRAANHANFIVVHDTEDAVYNYEQVFNDFKYRYDYKLILPETTILSNFKEYYG